MGDVSVQGGSSPPARMTTLRVNETFRSLQGEGPSIGQPALFLRLADCNLACSWCDTRYSWDWAQFDSRQERHDVISTDLAGTIITDLPESGLLVVTGGEPLLQQAGLLELIPTVRASVPGLRVEIETNGTVPPVREFSQVVNLFVVSPKLANSSLPEKRRIRPKALTSFPKDRSVLKFVVEQGSELREVEAIRTLTGVGRDRTWIMPEGTTREVILGRLEELSAPVVGADYNLSPRLHILLWSDARGK